MSRAVRIAPSLLSADFAKLGEEVRAIDKAGADLIHLDVMDGHFVPNITIGPLIVRALRPFSKKPFDVHLMVSPVDPCIRPFAEAGADIITVHPESGPHLHRTLQSIRALGKKAGVALNPSTPINAVENILDEVDLILVMTVNPGFGGQSFIKSQLSKIKKLRSLIAEASHEIDLEVDGGITSENASLVIAAGANILVAGTATFQGGISEYASNIKKLRG